MAISLEQEAPRRNFRTQEGDLNKLQEANDALGYNLRLLLPDQKDCPFPAGEMDRSVACVQY
ncbi:hypothetical protein SCBWM1_gp25 [Synechococcus phage S-CBWM1]|uniref:Uncharacterized protein n=1 Tax=Synechococcus phage S-CBWM1 TaxID=2053653 RepID=A0A3G1L3F3_9CAUD|nr:hypothetical protein HOU61_gp172 [Synechococcus phage S-CBWM1]ATW62709.1 hypothetical protein SCBWM1_gp25 [Synechococcus phage S-CBWM1]